MRKVSCIFPLQLLGRVRSYHALGLTTSYPDYADIPVNKDGDYQQLNDAILQIENEFYSTIRPKRSAASGERPLAALGKSGVEYVECGALLDPFEPIDNSEQIRFLDTFLLLCLLTESPTDSREESARMVRNQTAVVERGRQPGLVLERDTESVDLRQWATRVTRPVYLHRGGIRSARRQQLLFPNTGRKKSQSKDPESTPSAKVIAALNEGSSFLTSPCKTQNTRRVFANRTGNTAQQARLQTEAEILDTAIGY
ncbi:MAG: hypothetical protein CM15mP68_6250 [Pseudomonadota bacterium]|nr:MAG: hypothetical protein CM15mP68_6250 [Pseudomonadota bacterium]